MEPLLEWGLVAVRQVQALGPALKLPMQAFSFLGQEEFFLLFMPLFFWCLDKWAGANLAYVLILSTYFNGLLKGAFHLPRPYWLDSSLQQATEVSFGLPSGHAQNAVTVWGYIAFRLKKTWGWIVAVALIALVSFSRIYLGVHFPSDVAGGWLIGAVVLIGYAALQPRLTARVQKYGLLMQIALAVLAGAILLGVYDLTLILLSAGTISYAPEFFYAGLEEAQKNAFSSVGMLMGGGIGLALEMHYVRFDVAGPLWKRAARYAVGVIVVFGLWAGLKAIFPSSPDAAGMILRLVRFLVLILWVTWIWPWLFVKIGLAQAAALPARRARRR